MLPLNFNFAQDVIDKLAGEDRAGLVFVDAYGHRRDYTFAEISEQSQRYAAALRALGVTQDSRVLLCTSNTAKCLFTVLAIARLGGVAVPCEEDLAVPEILERARRGAVTSVITNRKRRPAAENLQRELTESTSYLLIGETCEGWARLDTLTQNAAPFRGITTQSMDMAYVFDDAVIDCGALLEARALAQAALEPVSSDRVWSTLPFGSEKWLTFAQAPWWRGASTVVHEGSYDPRERLDLVRELDVTILCQTPAEYEAQIRLPDLERIRLPRLRRCVATAPLDVDVQRRWSERFGLAIAVPKTPAPAPS